MRLISAKEETQHQSLEFICWTEYILGKTLKEYTPFDRNNYPKGPGPAIRPAANSILNLLIMWIYS